MWRDGTEEQLRITTPDRPALFDLTEKHGAVVLFPLLYNVHATFPLCTGEVCLVAQESTAGTDGLAAGSQLCLLFKCCYVCSDPADVR